MPPVCKNDDPMFSTEALINSIKPQFDKYVAEFTVVYTMDEYHAIP